jgi:hypothetical protein
VGGRKRRRQGRRHHEKSDGAKMGPSPHV